MAHYVDNEKYIKATPEDRKKMMDKYYEEVLEESYEFWKQCSEKKKQEKERQRQELIEQRTGPEETSRHRRVEWDNPNSLNNIEATIFWLIVAVGALFFVDGWMLSVLSTFVWWKYITRHYRD